MSNPMSLRLIFRFFARSEQTLENFADVRIVLDRFRFLRLYRSGAVGTVSFGSNINRADGGRLGFRCGRRAGCSLNAGCRWLVVVRVAVRLLFRF
jgi:hypothetical protein